MLNFGHGFPWFPDDAPGISAEAVGNTPDEFARLIAAELQKWTKVVAATGVKLE